jgi:Fe-S-cluster containining protein
LDHAAVRVLAFHSGYRCRHAGACCSSNWPIPIEADRLLRLQAALASRRVRPAAGRAATAVQVVADAPPDAAALLGRHESACVFYEADAATGEGRCRIHAALGHDSLPLACRQFPRVSLLDPRGVSVSLSHYCPTAAALLDADAPDGPAIELNAPAFPVVGEYVGFDARHAWPPLVRPDLLMDWDSWWDCERRAVDILLSDRDSDPAIGLTRLRAVVDDVRRWSPADGPLGTRVADAFARASRGTPTAVRAHPASVDAAFAAIPDDLRPDRFRETLTTSDRATKRFLAAHAFANWAAHSEEGLGAWMRSIDTAAALLDAGAGVRQADLILRHLAAN